MSIVAGEQITIASMKQLVRETVQEDEMSLAVMASKIDALERDMQALRENVMGLLARMEVLDWKR